MRRTFRLPGPLAACFVAVVLTGEALVAQQAQNPAAPPRHPSPSGMSQATLDEMLIRFPLPLGQEVYADNKLPLSVFQRPEEPTSTRQ